MDSAIPKPQQHLKNSVFVGAWALIFVAAIFAYWPGLSGPFLFDDFGSIADLGNRGGVRDWSTFKAFVFGGHSGPTGRPLALLSFLIDANDWPADAWPFKRTNLLIHLVNAGLLGILINKVLKIADISSQNARWAALISAGCWLLHPFLVSTTLYVVQRMAQLSALFVFAGLIGYLHGRVLVARDATRGYWIMSASVGLFTLLAMISKENGILLPLLVGTLEITIIASRRAVIPALDRYWAFVFLVMPAILISGYLGERFFRDNFFEAMPPRDFSIYERLLTQPRILVDYLRHWFVPELYTVGVFQDHFVKSTGFLVPVTTAISTAFHLTLIALALAMRRAWPLLALAILFFYAGHVLESTVINLELYFEHRNYLASAFLFVPLILLLQRSLGRKLFFTIALGAMLLLGAFTRYSATVWQDHASIVEASAQKAPTSARAQMLYATNLYNLKRFDESVQVIDTAVQTMPLNPSLQITRNIILCNMGVLTAADFDNSASIISASDYDPRSINMYTALSSAVVDARCPDISIASLRAMFASMLRVPKNGDRESLSYSQIQYFIGYAAVHEGEVADALTAFDESLRARSGASHAMKMAAVLASSNYYEEALYLSGKALSQLEADPRGLLQETGVSKSDILEFREIVRADMEAATN